MLLRIVTLMPVGILFFAIAGCGENSYSAEEIQRAKDALESALETWKKGEKATALQAKSIEFSDPEWRSGSKLTDFKIDRVEGVKGENLRGWTHVSLVTRQGKKLERDFCFEIRLKDKIVIGRDPMN